MKKIIINDITPILVKQIKELQELLNVHSAAGAIKISIMFAHSLFKTLEEAEGKKDICIRSENGIIVPIRFEFNRVDLQ